MTSEALQALSHEVREKLLQAFSDAKVTDVTLPAPKTSLDIAKEMVDSYAFDERTGVFTFTVPAGVTDVEAMNALNEYFRTNHPSFNRDAVYARALDGWEKLPNEFSEYCQERDYVQARQIRVTGVVQGTKGEYRATQERVLMEASLVFADPRDQALAAAIHACKHEGEDLFQGSSVRGSLPGFVVGTWQDVGVGVIRYPDDYRADGVAASGSPSPELK
jgi:hypothetical protein